MILHLLTCNYSFVAYKIINNLCLALLWHGPVYWNKYVKSSVIFRVMDSLSFMKIVFVKSLMIGLLFIKNN